MLKSSMHKNKQIVTIGEFIEMVTNQNWKRDVSYILFEELKEDKWRETELVPVSEAYDLNWNSAAGYLFFYTQDYSVDIGPVKEGTLMQELVDPESTEYRYTVYMT